MMYDFKSNNMEKIRDMMDVIPHRFFTNEPYGNKSWGIDVSTEMLFIKFDVEYDNQRSNYIKIFFEGDGVINIYLYDRLENKDLKHKLIDTHSYHKKEFMDRFANIMKNEFGVAWWCT